MPDPRTALRNDIRRIADHARHGRTVQLLVDFDGTIAPLTDDPLSARADPLALRSLYMLSRHPQVAVTFITGRSVNNLRERLGKTPGALLPFNIIGSFGTELQRAGKTAITLATLPAGSHTVLQEFNNAALSLQQNNPGLTVKKKYGSVSVDVRGMRDQDTIRRSGVIAEARKLFSILSAHPAMPMAGPDPLFQIMQDSTSDISIRSIQHDKAHAIRRARHIDPYNMTVFMGDSFDPRGGDHTAAVLVNDKTVFFKGMVIQVKNGRDGPVAPGTAAAPDHVLNDTKDCGIFLQRLLTAIAARPPAISRGNPYKFWPYFGGP